MKIYCVKCAMGVMKDYEMKKNVRKVFGHAKYDCPSCGYSIAIDESE